MSHFGGTAAFYARFRPRYPPELWDRLTAEAGADRSGRVLDLGSGPGTASLELASRVGSVVAVDMDAGMVAEGRRLAEAAGVDTIEWVNAPAEAVDYPPESFRLIVIASAFHWMDRHAVATRCRSMLYPDGLLAVLGNPTPLLQISDRTPLGAAIAEVQSPGSTMSTTCSMWPSSILRRWCSRSAGFQRWRCRPWLRFRSGPSSGSWGFSGLHRLARISALVRPFLPSLPSWRTPFGRSNRPVDGRWTFRCT